MINSLAVQLHAAGLKVFPCTASKAPAVPRGVDWHTVAQQPPQALQWRTGFVGVPVPPGVVILDLDLYKGVTREAVEALIGCRLEWDRALIQKTQNGGEHYAFAVSWEPKQGSQLEKLDGFDTRVAGKGYIATGPGYEACGFGLFAMTQPHGLPTLPDAARTVLERIDPPPRQSVDLPEGDRDLDTIRAALRHLEPGCSRTDWLRVGLALRHHFHDDPETGLALFDEWSRGALTPDGQEPDNYSADTMDHQWYSFKPEGGITIGTLFYSAIEAGWNPPANAAIDTSAAFGATTAPAEQFDNLIDRITEQGGNPKSTNGLIQEVQALPCNELQRGMLLAALHRELKDAGLLTPEVKQALQGQRARPTQAAGEYDKNHTVNAATFLDSHYPDGQLVRSDQVWYKFNGKAWEQIDDDQIKHEVAIALAPSKPQHSTVSGTTAMIECLSGGASRKIGDVPAGIVLYQNGALDLTTGQLLPHSRDYFTTNILPYNYRPGAEAPHWAQFLRDVFEDDYERIGLLQEWFGYMLSNTYEHQKIMFLLGPKRSGKGTIGRVLKVLVGSENYSAGTLSAFAKDSYLESLRTKTVVFIGDAPKKVPVSIVDAVTERLKGISGCDDQTFDRKYKSTLTEPLPSRITIAANNVPRLFDDSGALASRLLVLPFNVSWYDREDPELFDRLVAEIEGIAVWALQGLARLRQRGRFTMPQASQAEAEYIKEAYSPLQNFMATCCVMGGDNFTTSADVYEAYRVWALNTGEDSILSRRPFVSSFKDLIRGTGAVYGSHRRQDGTPDRGFKGLTLRPIKTDAEAATAPAFKVVK